jgi:hypothetical protein
MPSRRLRSVFTIAGVTTPPTVTRGYNVADFDSPTVVIHHVSVTLCPADPGIFVTSAVILNDFLPNGQPAYSSALPDPTVDFAGVFYPTPSRLCCCGLTSVSVPSYHSSVSVSGDNHCFLQLLVTATDPGIRFFALIDFSFST